MQELIEMMKKKGKSKMSPEYKDAKMSMLGELKNSMKGEMAGDLGSLKKGASVTVAASDPSKLKEGLEQAEDVVEELPEAPGHMMKEPSSVDEVNEMIQQIQDPEEIEALLQHLNMQKSRLMNK